MYGAVPVGRSLPKLVKRSIVRIKTLMKRWRARLRPVISLRCGLPTPHILTSPISTVVDFCIRRPLRILGSAILLAAAYGIYAGEHFAVKTDINALISPDLPWAKRALEYMREFPQFGIIIVIDAPTSELAEQASTDLTRALLTHPERFRAVSQPGSGKFFQQNGLLFLPTDEVARFTNGARQADALIAALAEDASLRGSLSAMSMAFIGVKRAPRSTQNAFRAKPFRPELSEIGLPRTAVRGLRCCRRAIPMTAKQFATS